MNRLQSTCNPNGTWNNTLLMSCKKHGIQYAKSRIKESMLLLKIYTINNNSVVGLRRLEVV